MTKIAIFSLFLRGETMVLRRIPNTVSTLGPHLCLVRQISSLGPDDVIFNSIADKGVITLNRPQALNVLNLPMVKKIYAQLQAWEAAKAMVIVKGTGGAAFSAGGDVNAIALYIRQSVKTMHGFLKLLYQISGLVGRYKTPYVAFIDGIVVGAGAGLSVHGRYRVATERSLFAMPEAQNGMFPGVGGSYFFPKMPGKLGLYLALTGHRLQGVELFEAGVATHYTDSKNLEELERALLNTTSDQSGIDDVLEKFSTRDEGEFSLAPVLAQIDSCFNGGSVGEIVQRLERDGSEWAKETVNLLRKMSPTSLKITLKQLELGAKLSLKECLEMEHRMVVNCLANKDFYEGLRAYLIDKEPRWNPAKLEDVSPALVDSYFAELPDDEELRY